MSQADSETKRKPGRKRTKDAQPSVRSLDRGLAVLELLSEHKQLALTDIAKRLELANSTTYRLLDTLRLRGFVQQDEQSGHYLIGLRAFEVGSSFGASQKLHEVAHPFMKKLVEELGETVNLAVLTGNKASYVHQVEGNHMMRTFVQMGAQVPLYCTGVGKMLVAWRNEQDVRDLLKGESFEPLTSYTLTSLDAFVLHLDGIRKRGYALDDQEVELGVRCLAAPVFNKQDEVVAALSLSAPATRLLDKALASVATQVVSAAQEVSKQLGWRT